ncbi:hypothetical protein BN1708_010439, partial [Verticillium longisporum]
MLLHGAQSPPPAPVTHHQPDLSTRPRRKRKAETQDNERLSKRLSLLNLEQNGQKLYVPVETPNATALPASALTPAARAAAAAASPANDDDMHLDDTKHKVYIYSLDDELSSSDSDPDDGRLVFLPDIERHLRAARLVDPGAAPLVSVPRPIPPAPDGSLAGMQKDSVRKAIIESRARTRARQRLERDGSGDVVEMPPRLDPSVVQGLMAAQGTGVDAMATGHDDDADAMELD